MAMTNFFSQLAAIDFTGCLNLNFRKDGESLTVSVLLVNDGCGDTAKKHIPPLLLKGNAKELGEGFFPAIVEPVQQASGLLINMEQFLKGQEEAKKQSAMEKKKNEKSEKADKTHPQDPKAKKFLEIMGQVDSLEADGKYKEAWCKVPQPSEYPDKADELRERKKSLREKFAPDLFGAAQTDNENEPKSEDYDNNEPNAEVVPDEGTTAGDNLG